MASVGKDTTPNKSTGKYVRQGHTAGPYGNTPTTPSVNKGPRELTP